MASNGSSRRAQMIANAEEAAGGNVELLTELLANIDRIAPAPRLQVLEPMTALSDADCDLIRQNVQRLRSLTNEQLRAAPTQPATMMRLGLPLWRSKAGIVSTADTQAAGQAVPGPAQPAEVSVQAVEELIPAEGEQAGKGKGRAMRLVTAPRPPPEFAGTSPLIGPPGVAGETPTATTGGSARAFNPELQYVTGRHTTSFASAIAAGQTLAIPSQAEEEDRRRENFLPSLDLPTVQICIEPHETLESILDAQDRRREQGISVAARYQKLVKQRQQLLALGKQPRPRRTEAQRGSMASVVGHAGNVEAPAATGVGASTVAPDAQAGSGTGLPGLNSLQANSTTSQQASQFGDSDAAVTGMNNVSG